MKSLLESIDARLAAIILESEGPTKPTIIDPYDQESAAPGLKNCRGPYIGHDDYIAGNDYIPPRYYDSDVPYGPEADKDSFGNYKNKHAVKYGGVRPWTMDEIMRVLMARTDDRSTNGLLNMIASKPAVANAFLSAGKSYNIEDAVSLGASAAYRATLLDQARIGVRFTSYIGMGIEEGMRSGVPPGFHDEYRDARGLLERWTNAGKKVAKAPNTANAILADIAIRDGDRWVIGYKDGNKIAPFDPKPGPRNAFGQIVTKLVKVGNSLITAIQSGNSEQILAAVSDVENLKSELTEQEELYKERGASTDTLISKSKTNKPIKASPLMMTGKDSDKEAERHDLAYKDKTAIGDSDKEILRHAINKLRSGVGEGAGYQAKEALGIINSIKDILNTPSKQRKKFHLRRNGEEYEIHDENGIVQSIPDEQQAKERMMELSSDPRITKLDSIRHNLSVRRLGEFASELSEVSKRLSAALKASDTYELSEVSDELDDLEAVAMDQANRGESNVKQHPITQQQYRLLLRLFGIDNYKEKGTTDDPEIDENGQLSDWAKMGYPQIIDNKTLAQHLAVSSVRISQLKNIVIPLIQSAVQDLQESTSNVGYYFLLTETRIKLGRLLLHNLFG